MLSAVAVITGCATQDEADGDATAVQPGSSMAAPDSAPLASLGTPASGQGNLSPPMPTAAAPDTEDSSGIASAEPNDAQDGAPQSPTANVDPTSSPADSQDRPGQDPSNSAAMDPEAGGGGGNGGMVAVANPDGVGAAPTIDSGAGGASSEISDTSEAGGAPSEDEMMEAAGFQPCPTTEACKILPLGDSITDGLGVPGGGSYRIELFRLALADGKDITYVGNSQNGPADVDGQPFPKAHEGHSGWTIEQIDGIVPDPALEDGPHIVLLHIGTNDMYQTPAGAADRLETLLDQIIETLPDSLLVVSTIIPFPGAPGEVASYNSGVVTVVQARIDAGEHILLVDQFEGFPEGELADGVHPNEAGYARMAAKWYEAIVEYLP